jgi:hypothetical protein
MAAFQRSIAAVRAISLRCSGVSAAARASPRRRASGEGFLDSMVTFLSGL